jgi:hypothetical protein
MRPLRILIAGLCVAIIVAGSAVAIALHNQARLIRLVLSRIHAETGYDVVPKGARLAFHSHLEVLLEQPIIYLNGTEVARVDDLRAVIRYHAIFSTSGLPLYELALDHPQVRAPAQLEGLTPYGFPKPDIAVVTRLKWALDSISDVAQRIEIVNAALKDVDGAPLVDHLTLTAYRQHRGRKAWPWMVTFDAGWNHAPFDGAAVTGKFRLGAAPGVASDMVATGSMKFHGLELAPFNGPYGIDMTGQIAGALKFAMRQDGEVFGEADTDVKRLVLKGKPFSGPITLGDATVHAAYKASLAQVELKEFSLTRDGATLLSGGGTIDRPYDDTRSAALHLEGVRITLTQAAAWIRLLRFVPAPVNDLLRRFPSGLVALTAATFNPSTPVKDWNAQTLRGSLTARGNLTAGGFDAPPNLKLPPIRRLEAAVVYTGGLLTLTQASASLGKSTLAGVTAEVNFKRAPALISYKLRGKGSFDAGELHPALNRVIAAVDPDLATHIAGISGTSAIELSASGEIASMKLSVPSDYTLEVSPKYVELTIKGAPSAIAINGGNVRLKPGVVQINQLVGGLPALSDGSATLNGTILERRQYPIFRDCVVEFREFRAETWLPLVVDPKEASAQGPVSGRLTAQSDAKHVAVPMIAGRLRIGKGQLQFGFLRSPIEIQTMTVALDGQGMKIDVPGASLEGSPVSLSITMAQFADPLVHLDANASDLDFEVMRFIRMPWSPKTPATVFDLPIEGHIAAARGHFGKLPLSNLNTDFDRMNGAWHVRDFTASSLDGRMKLDIAGRSGPDNRIHMKAFIDTIDARALCVLMGQSSPALTGRLSATGDLWGDTDVDFFSSLTGKFAVSAIKGTLNRFAVVTRVLSFIDLKNWLSARLPDPRINGIPFDTFTATFNGTYGNFHTKDMRLSGPVMEITASGDVNVGNNTMDMVISLIPFDTVNWLVRHIPIIGANLAGGSHGLIAAYFHVSGPIDNPSVVPKPITSVAEFVAKALSMPINIIAPNTIKP